MPAQRCTNIVSGRSREVLGRKRSTRYPEAESRVQSRCWSPVRGEQAIIPTKGAKNKVNLKAKARGENSMPEKQEVLEGAEDMDLQDPRDRAKAILPESQSPVVEPHTHCYSV